jgi:peptide-methionine (R)-S-oxide reductase
MMRRAAFLGFTAATVGAFSIRGLTARAAATHYAVTHSDAQWLRLLGPDRYNILRENSTEPPFSSPLIKETRAGIYNCAGCDLALFSSKVKYDSGDGWPSFWTVLPDTTLTGSDYQLIEERTEVHCRRCGGHLGHIFNDGPKPTGLRYCIDGLALRFNPSA